jgi:hypothetical protein
MMWLEGEEAEKNPLLTKSISTAQQQTITTNNSQSKPTSFPLGCIILYYNNASSHNSSPKSKRRNAHAAICFIHGLSSHIFVCGTRPPMGFPTKDSGAATANLINPISLLLSLRIKPRIPKSHMICLVSYNTIFQPIGR